ncbi:hypothetical protein MHU86_808 [Fragilaria crotonensis]|nr:hypothetical protein MHU86_808 [Fragilaria crotonensis]
MTVTLVDTRPSAGTGSAVYDQVDDHNHVSNNRQPTPDLVPLKHQSVAGNEDSSSTTANRLNPEAHASSGVPDNGDVSAVVDKAKRAAQSLWVLIHAQNCRMGGDRCPHKGCVEAKRVLLHLKTCPSGNNSCSCPSDYNGCHQSRKLLSHYQKCREVRAKQAVSSTVQVESLTQRNRRLPRLRWQSQDPVIGRRTSEATMPRRRRDNLASYRQYRVGVILATVTHRQMKVFLGNCSTANQLMLFSEVVAAATLLRILQRTQQPWFQNPTRGTQHQPNLRVDPTWELDLKGEQMIDVVSEEKTSSGFVNRRGRSASLGMLASACLSRDGCDTIVEEEYAREGSAMDEELTFTMDEDGL